MEAMFQSCQSLTSLIMYNSDYNSVNKIIAELPTKAADSMGTLIIAGVDDINQVDITTAESKFWNIINETSYFVLGKSKLGQAKLK
jgi:hypothetical protein